MKEIILLRLLVLQSTLWTRGDKWVNNWYKSKRFNCKESYLHVYTEGKECDEVTEPKLEKLCICNCFANYVGENIEDIKKHLKEYMNAIFMN